MNTVNPGPTDPHDALHRGHARAGPRRGVQAAAARGSLDRRYGEPEEVARMMLFLRSEESAHCTGGVFVVDGGLTL